MLEMTRRGRLLALLFLLVLELCAWGWTLRRWPKIEKARCAGACHLAGSQTVAAKVGLNPRIEPWTDFSLAAGNLLRFKKVVWTCTLVGPKSSCAADVEIVPNASGWDIVGINLWHGGKDRW